MAPVSCRGTCSRSLISVAQVRRMCSAKTTESCCWCRPWGWPACWQRSYRDRHRATGRRLASARTPLADTTDVYAFVSPDRPDTVTFIANWIPLEEPAGGPNFNKFGDDVRYRINIDNNGDASDDIIYEWRFTTRVLNPNTFLYNTGPDHLARRP